MQSLQPYPINTLSKIVTQQYWFESLQKRITYYVKRITKKLTTHYCPANAILISVANNPLPPP